MVIISNMDKQTIAFDLDGTLIDVSIRDYQIYVDIINELGGAPIDYATYWPMRKERTDIHHILELSKIVKDDDVRKFLHERKARMEDIHYLELDSILNNVIPTLDFLSSKYNICIITIRHNRENTISQLKRLELDKYRVYIVEKEKTETLTAIPNIIAMVGDTENDINPSKNLGIKSIAVTTGIRSKRLLSEMNPDFIIDNLDELKVIL